MTRFYKLAVPPRVPLVPAPLGLRRPITSRPQVLLIEFDDSRPFSLQTPAQVGPEIAAGNIISKLVLLTLHFPTLRIMSPPPPPFVLTGHDASLTPY